MKLAAAMPNMAGIGPSTGMVRTLKLGMIYAQGQHHCDVVSRGRAQAAIA